MNKKKFEQYKKDCKVYSGSYYCVVCYIYFCFILERKI